MVKILLVCALVLFLSAVSIPAQRPIRVNFARGAYCKNVSGTLTSYRSSRTYLVRVRSGQTLKTESIGSRYITIYITDPNGEPVGDSDASCNDRREITPTVAGDYRIKVVECQKADPWRGTFRFRVSVR
jgi:hypothetical protein